MKKLAVVVIVALTVCVGCGGPKPREESVGAVYPVDLKVEVNHEMMTLSWRTSSDAAISGYNIYISPVPLALDFPGSYIDTLIEPFNPTPFPGDTNPDDGIQFYEATHLDNAVRYFVTVRVVYPDQSVSRPSNEVIVACGARTDIELAVRYQSDNDGYAFAQNQYVRADAAGNDLYFFSKDGVDYLGSPKRLDNFIRDTRFVALPYKGSLEEILAVVGNADLSEAVDQAEIFKGDWFLLYLDDDRHAYVKVKGLTESGKDRRVQLFVAYAAMATEF